MTEFEKVLDFWFKEAGKSKWFAKDQPFDAEIRKRFGDVHKQARAGELWKWRESIQGRLAEIIVLDQFSRNMFRNQPEAFAYDNQSLILAQEALKDENLNNLTSEEKAFLYMPFMHSESMVIQEISLTLFQEKGLEENYIYAREHHEIIQKFGRYPHRNEILNRESTEEELKFLETHNGF